ncbi:dynein light chain Tctex-type protein 2B isoform X2 [Anastrepha obliqua]|uniref:dynein light chain Tctex-type protein 2B isoform X2 n=1 Tax=Anastrepha ludens TaxID=28586 RepID=UPI0023B00ED6|nr:dynein light chain Tctex-type protein 2B isoform X2 [Anastrepha ludens]XP_054738176.1 dynein light chain Tctex-type protein 2B isoform X2 [Anastrepha obliqua]
METTSEKRGSLKLSSGRRTSGAFTVPQARPVLKYLPTYRLDPKLPLNKEVCEKIIQTVMDDAFENFIYSPKQSLTLCAQISEEIKNRVKSQHYDRYRYVCIVSIGEKIMQGYCSLVNFLWDAEKDGYISYVYDTPKFWGIATLYYLYYD